MEDFRNSEDSVVSNESTIYEIPDVILRSTSKDELLKVANKTDSFTRRSSLLVLNSDILKFYEKEQKYINRKNNKSWYRCLLCFRKE